MTKAMRDFLDFLEQAMVVRRIILFTSCWLTWDSYRWASEFAMATDKAGLEVAAVVAAVTTPVSWITIAVFKTYVEGKV